MFSIGPRKPLGDEAIPVGLLEFLGLLALVSPFGQYLHSGLLEGYSTLRNSLTTWTLITNWCRMISKARRRLSRSSSSE